MALSIIFLLFSMIIGTLSQDAPGEAQPCNSCCQGPAGLAGTPGIPGIPGAMGASGRDGLLRGEIGMKGDAGETGDVGDRGLEGPKGSKGDMPLVQKSAFSVFKTLSQIGNINDVLTFDYAEVNVGSDFNMATDKFTCEIPGTYVFMFKIFINREADDPRIDLVKDDVLITRADMYTPGEGTSSKHHSSTGTAIVQLSAGNQVWLKFVLRNGEQVYGSTSKYTSFSGFLLYPE